MSLLVIVPVLGRAHHLAPLIESLEGSERITKLELVFVANDDDTEVLETLPGLGHLPLVLGPREPGDYARKVNRGFAYGADSHEWFFHGSTDICFCPGWADIAIGVGLQSGRRVIGTNDLGNRTVMAGRHATHNVFHVSYGLQYGTLSGEAVMYEGYDHNYVDTEFVETAKFRDEWIFAKDSHVEHLHPFWHKNTMDEVYQMGQAHSAEDRKLYLSRQHLWRS